MGCSTFSNFTVLPEIALAKIRKDAPFDKVCYIGCGVTTGVGAVINTAKVKPGDNVIVFGLGGIGLNVIQGARLVGANMIVGVDLNPARKGIAEKFGMTHFVNPKEVEGDLVPYLVDDHRRRRGSLFRMLSAIPSAMRHGTGSAATSGWGDKHHHRRGRCRSRKSQRGRSSWSPAGVWRGTAFGGAKGRTDVPKIVDMVHGPARSRSIRSDHAQAGARRHQ